MATEPISNMLTSARAGASTFIMESRQAIESARLTMLEARKALEDYERLKGAASSPEHTALIRVFTKAAQTYLKLSASQP